jgi:hypothetical protein
MDEEITAREDKRLLPHRWDVASVAAVDVGIFSE